MTISEPRAGEDLPCFAGWNSDARGHFNVGQVDYRSGRACWRPLLSLWRVWPDLACWAARPPIPAASPRLALNTPAPQVTAAAADRKHTLVQYCSGCHNDTLKTAGWSVTPLDPEHLEADNALWEKILRRVSLGEMPPRGMPRPPKEQIADFTHWLAGSLDAMALAHPNPGHATLRRMNRAEYANAVRDLLGLEVDLSKDLPVDDTGYGLRHIADVLTVSSTLMDRYINVAGKVARLATGQASRTPADHRLPHPQGPVRERLRRAVL